MLEMHIALCGTFVCIIGFTEKNDHFYLMKRFDVVFTFLVTQSIELSLRNPKEKMSDLVYVQQLGLIFFSCLLLKSRDFSNFVGRGVSKTSRTSEIFRLQISKWNAIKTVGWEKRRPVTPEAEITRAKIAIK